MIELMLVPLAAALLMAGMLGYLGIHIIARGVIFVDLALAQVAAFGYTLGTLLGLPHGSLAAYGLSVAATLIGAFVLSVTRIDHKHVPQEALIGVVYVAATAATILLAAQAPRGAEHVEELLTGTLLWVTWPEIFRMGLIYAAIGAVHWLLHDRFFRISLEPEKAAAKGWRLKWWDFLFYGLFGVVVTSSVEIAGVLVVFTFLVIPAVIAFLFVSTPRHLLMLAWAVGALTTLVGLVLSFQLDLPTGPVIVCVFAAVLVLALFLRRGRGTGPRPAGP